MPHCGNNHHNESIHMTLVFANRPLLPTREKYRRQYLTGPGFVDLMFEPALRKAHPYRQLWFWNRSIALSKLYSL